MSEATAPPTVQTVQPASAAQSGDPRFGESWFEIAEDQQGRWHWCLWTTNGRPMARSGVAYERRKDVIAAVKLLRQHVAAARRVIYCKPPGG